MSLDVRATRGTGDLTFTCKNSQTTWGTTDVTIANPGDRTEVSCTFTASGKMSIVQLVPSDAMVADTFERSFSTALVDGDGSNSGNNDGTGTAVLLFVGALVMIGVLAGAVLLTREREEELNAIFSTIAQLVMENLKGMKPLPTLLIQSTKSSLSIPRLS